jgi:alpha-tubulin suppressor-like RCC1 family protein
VAAGELSTCAVTTGGSVWCWGRNDQGQLGDATTTSRTSPVQVTGSGGVGTLSGVSVLGVGQKHACARTSAGSVWCWGQNNQGQLGDTTTTDRPSPVQVTDVGGTSHIADALDSGAGVLHSCAVRPGGTVWCWGDNPQGQLGDGTTSDAASPVQVL